MRRSTFVQSPPFPVGCRIFLLAWLFFIPRSNAIQRPIEQHAVLVGRGWHPWYELKVDPQDPRDQMVCGSLWDAGRNTLFGFVYSSNDSGRTWMRALEDRSSNWVSEQSCAFGRAHRAYFLSEASEVDDGVPHHYHGTARLYTSGDGGRHWIQAAQTAWADWSTSAVSQLTGQLITFFNYGNTVNPSRNRGTTVGVLISSARGKRLSGPWFSIRMRKLNYHGVYPDDATTLPDGKVVALYEGFRNTPAGTQSDLGIEYVELIGPVRTRFSRIASSKPGSIDGCMADHALAYDAVHHKLVVVYGEDTKAGCRTFEAASTDEGNTWQHARALRTPSGMSFMALKPSIAFSRDGRAAMLWSDRGTWHFGLLNGPSLVTAPEDLGQHGPTSGVVSDSLFSVFRGSGGQASTGDDSVVDVAADAGLIWRCEGLVSVGNQFEGVFLRVESDSDELVSAILPAAESARPAPRVSTVSGCCTTNVTRLVKLRYGQSQSFDNATGTLSLDVALTDIGDTPIHTPIFLKVEAISSAVGTVTILNATNGLHSSGAVWDLSRCVVGDRLPPGATTYNTFTLLFHIDLDRRGLITTDDLLKLRVSIVAAEPSRCVRTRQGE